jgi:hypothetical protein
MNVQLLNTTYTLAIALLILLLGVNTLWAFWPLKGKSSYFSRETNQNKNKLIVKISSFLWRKKYRQLIAGATLLLALVIPWLDNLFSLNIEAKDELSSILLVVTAGIVFWNMRETFDLKVIQQKQQATQQRQEAIQLKQFEFENRPYIRITWPDNGDILHITNQGKGLARDVFIEAVRLDAGENPKLVFKIAPGETAAVTIDEIQRMAGLADTNGYADYITPLRGIIDECLKEGRIKKIHLSYIDLGGNIYDAFFVPREDVQGRFIVDSQEKRT